MLGLMLTYKPVVVNQFDTLHCPRAFLATHSWLWFGRFLAKHPPTDWWNFNHTLRYTVLVVNYPKNVCLIFHSSVSSFSSQALDPMTLLPLRLKHTIP